MALSTWALRCAISSARVPASTLASWAEATASPASASLSFRQKLRIVDLVQQLARGDIVAALDRALADPAVDARRDVDARRVRFSLNDERLRLDQIPERKANDRSDNERDNKRGPSRDLQAFAERSTRCLARRESEGGAALSLAPCATAGGAVIAVS